MKQAEAERLAREALGPTVKARLVRDDYGRRWYQIIQRPEEAKGMLWVPENEEWFRP